jgi:hypothetical protein
MKGARLHAMGPFGRAVYLIQQFPFLTFSYPKSEIVLIGPSPMPIVNTR